MKKIHKIIIYTISITCIFVFTFSVATLNQSREPKVVQTSATIQNVEGLNNKKIGWGIKRVDNHEQPDVGAKNKEILDKYEGLSIGNKESKNVYLTFDEGYEAGYTEKILEVLKQNEVKACFFITAHYVNTEAELVQKMIDDGHIIGNHTVNHKSMPDLDLETIKKEVMGLHTTIYQKYNYEMKYLRPPKGEYSEKTIAYTKNLGYTTVMWSMAYDDWDEQKQGRETYAKQKILDNVHNGAIILLHGNSKDNTNVLDYCIKEIKNMGYEFKILDEFER